MRIMLNDLLQLSAEDLLRSKIKFNQHDGITDPKDEYVANPETINSQWLFWRNKKRNFNIGELAICLFQLKGDTWLLSTIKEVTKELGCEQAVNYQGVEITKYKPYFGRVLIKYHKQHQAQTVKAGKYLELLEVEQILPTIYDGEDFPGYDKVCLSYRQLATIIKRNKRDWLAALENQKAVYMISDLKTGKQYIGSAYGENGMLWQRWASYVANLHGGNKELKEITNKKGAEYIKKYFQYAILENYNSTVSTDFILEREQWWKKVLGSKETGLNRN